MPMDASERSLRARIGAHSVHATHDGAELTKRARETFLAGFPVQVDPDGLLSREERARRADHALRAHMSKLSLMAAKARKAKAEESAPPTDEVAT
jgi:hypothetical protein